MTWVITAASNCAREEKIYWDQEKYGKALLKGAQARAIGTACAVGGIPCMVVQNVLFASIQSCVFPLMGDIDEGKKALETTGLMAFDVTGVLLANAAFPEYVAERKIDKLIVDRLVRSTLGEREID